MIRQRSRHGEDDEAGARRQTLSLAGLAVSLFLVVVSLGLVQVLRDRAVVEDCLLSGRAYCGRGWSWPNPAQPQSVPAQP